MRWQRRLAILWLLFANANVTYSGQEDQAITGNRLASQAFHEAAEKILPSLVTIETFGGVTAGARRGRISELSQAGVGPTTGLIVSEDGYIITSTYNFRDKPTIITVTLRDGTKQVAQLLGRDNPRHLCLLKVEPSGKLTVPVIAPIGDLKVGHWAISVGVGYGDFEPAISAGIISALKRDQGRALQTDANISPANYGGPLLAIDGRVIGICVPLNPKAKDATASVEWYDSGIGFVIPLSQLDECINKMKQSP